MTIWSGEIEHRLDELAKREREDTAPSWRAFVPGAPNAIPGPRMRTLWRLLLTGRVKSWLRDFDLYRWCERFKRDGLTDYPAPGTTRDADTTRIVA
jgi:hypothetical protein